MNETLRTLIIEDEEPARILLRHFLADFVEIELIGECEDGFTGMKTIQELRPDLIFLDIQMPRLNGFELVELLDELPEIIFTTAYDEYAIKAFELNAVDYLMKPFSKDRLRVAVDKVIGRAHAKTGIQTQLHQLVGHWQSEPKKIERIAVKSGAKIHLIPVEEIEHIEAQDDYVMIYCSEGRFLKKETLTNLEQGLPYGQFLRVHRSHLVNIRQILRIEQYGKESYSLLLKNGNKVNVSKSRVKELKQELDF